MLYALLDQTDTITPDHLNAAYALWRYCDDSARYIFGERLGDPRADELLRLLRTAGPAGMTRTEMYQALSCNVKSEVIGVTLLRLQRENLVYATRKTGGKGRPTETWHPYVRNVLNVINHQNGSTPMSDASQAPRNKYVLNPLESGGTSLQGINTYLLPEGAQPATPHQTSSIGINTFNTFNTYQVCMHREVAETSTGRVCQQCGEVIEDVSPTARGWEVI
jgi:hypothetical protein